MSARRFIAIAATAALISVSIAGCGPTPPPPPTPGPGPTAPQPTIPETDPVAIVCGKARIALEAVELEGTSQRTYLAVEDFLNAAVQSGDPVMLYGASQVGESHRGSAPELTLGPALANMVQTCVQGGY
ncbi:hypothetical protein [Actinoplanes sp. NPDC049118]|uniref:hypothetical protein n=1 Tax=Actinoplanes sp. NPDC049118 TaxID=3155769 RepID=UPI0033E46623